MRSHAHKHTNLSKLDIRLAVDEPHVGVRLPEPSHARHHRVGLAELSAVKVLVLVEKQKNRERGKWERQTDRQGEQRGKTIAQYFKNWKLRAE